MANTAKKLTVVQGDPVTYMAFKWAKKDGKPFKYGSTRYASTRLAKAVNRYTSGMTVGHGWYTMYTTTDQPGAEMRGVYGAFADGRLCVEMPGAGCCCLGLEDVEFTDTSALTDEEKQFLFNLPRISLIRDDEIINLDGTLLHSKITHPKQS